MVFVERSKRLKVQIGFCMAAGTILQQFAGEIFERRRVLC